ncbi:MAG: hypothetical protein EOP36_16670 [Rubrivivax sp.]|nr:MAG: hypothetical protein EOP36_16670 [Rubrivivax sp.]
MSAGRFALNRVAVAAACAALSLLPAASWALGLGRLNVQSALGESLRAEIDITSLTPEEGASLQVKVASPETYRAAGVDYNQVLGATSIVLQRRTDGRSFLKITSDRSVQEPFIDVILDLAWSSGRLVREYTLLFDPPSSARPQAQTVAPTMDAPEPAPAPRPAPAPAPVAAAPRAPALEAPKPRTRPAPAASAASAPASAPVAPPPAPAEPVAERPPAPARSSAESVRVRRGDSLSQIAGSHLPSGVSLDQMLVGLYRNNPQAFQGDNMNRLKSGVVLNMPTAEQAKAVSTPEARQIIVAQSADFAAYRQRLAGAVTATAPEKPQRQAAGKVEAEVKDQKQSAAPTPDKLTLSKGGLSNKASAPGTEDRLAKARAQKENEARVAELSKNLDDLRKLKEKAAAAPTVKPAPAPAPVPAPVASKPAPVPPPAVAVPASKPAPAASVAAPVPSAPAVVASAASAAAPAASEVASAASEAATSVANVASEAAPAASEPVSAPVVPKPLSIPDEPQAEAPGLLESLNPMLLAGVGAGVALLAGVAMFLRSRRRADTGETSFLESRLQPDSFFGASGGQRVDTRDATGAPSSMSYSLSQLDAIGDVDPVAEADVYLAYGRDLQAEEILKEALRSTPERLAIRTKLLEVYAKRRDTKGYEQLASQLYNLTGGQGDDWAKAQEMGLGIDPENPLYQPGGQPSSNTPLSVEPHDSLGASTIPHSVMPTPVHLENPDTAPMESADRDLVDLDLDISAPMPLSEPETPEHKSSLQFDAFADMPSLDLPGEPAPQAPAASPAVVADESHDLDFDLPLMDEPTAAAPVPASAPAEPAFDLADLSLDLDAPAPAPTPEPQDLSLDEGLSEPSDPMERKFELAEEFRQIGDVDGARELLQEVVANATGALQVKAKSMLDSLS